jgi:hypothetical protein
MNNTVFPGLVAFLLGSVRASGTVLFSIHAPEFLVFPPFISLPDVWSGECSLRILSPTILST